MDATREEQDIKRMADLLRKGATLTDLACPACASPLFRVKDGTLWCGKDEKRVIIVKEAEETADTSGNSALKTLETTLTTKIQEIQEKVQRTDNVEELQKLSSALSELLNNLDKVRRMKS